MKPMKLKSLLLTSLFAAAAAFSLGAQAATDANKAAEAKAPAAGMPADMKMKPEDKATAPQKTPDEKAGKPNPTKDKKKHLHPRDGK